MPSKDIYFYTHFAPEVRIHLESGAFRALCKHLNDRSDSVQNIDLMIVGGFGRNCLAKWLVKEARNLSANSEHPNPKDAALLDAFGHSQATREVYGCDFFRWKKKYPQKTSFEQMQKYQESESIHAVHKEDKMLKSGMTVAMTQDFEQKFKMSLEAGAFRSLLEHLSDRSDIVQNIELMTISGFCRNCLAKVRCVCMCDLIVHQGCQRILNLLQCFFLTFSGWWLKHAICRPPLRECVRNLSLMKKIS